MGADPRAQQRRLGRAVRTRRLVRRSLEPLARSQDPRADHAHAGAPRRHQPPPSRDHVRVHGLGPPRLIAPPPGRTRTRLLRYRGSGSARSGDSEPPARELSPDPTLNPACPRSTTCGSYLARDPARVAPLRVAFYGPERKGAVEA